MEIQTAQLADFSMDYIVFGSGKQNLVIIPGLSIKSVLSSRNQIERAYSEFKKKYTVYLFDRRNELPENYSIRQIALDQIAVLKKIGISRADFFGTSQGGMICLALALENPEMVGKLVVGSSAAKIDSYAAGKLNRWINFANSGDVKGLVSGFLDDVYTPGFVENSRDVIISLHSDVNKDVLNRFAKLAGTIFDFNVFERLSEIKCPVFVIGAKQDKVFSSEPSEAMAKKIGKNCSLFVYKEYGHAAYDEAPDYKEKILDFLSR